MCSLYVSLLISMATPLIYTQTQLIGDLIDECPDVHLVVDAANLKVSNVSKYALRQAGNYSILKDPDTTGLRTFLMQPGHNHVVSKSFVIPCELCSD
jgi:hypothetical protein